MIREQELYPLGLVFLCMGGAEMHGRLVSPNDKMAQAVQAAASLVTGCDCWVGDRWVNAFEYIGQPDSVIDIYNSFVSSFNRGDPKRVLSFRARALFDANAIPEYKVFYVYPILALGSVKSRKRAGRCVQLPKEVTASLSEKIGQAYRMQGEPSFLVPYLLHRSKIAQAIESHNAQSLVATLKQGKAGPDDLPEPVNPFFKLSSEWPQSFQVPVYGAEDRRIVSHVCIPEKYKTPATLEALSRKGWTVASS